EGPGGGGGPPVPHGGSTRVAGVIGLGGLLCRPDRGSIEGPVVAREQLRRGEVVVWGLEVPEQLRGTVVSARAVDRDRVGRSLYGVEADLAGREAVRIVVARYFGQCVHCRALVDREQGVEVAAGRRERDSAARRCRPPVPNGRPARIAGMVGLS